jgi:hypothetical protein
MTQIWKLKKHKKTKFQKLLKMLISTCKILWQIIVSYFIIYVPSTEEGINTERKNGSVIMNSEEPVSNYSRYEPHFNTLP